MEIPKFDKTEDELVTMYDKWMYVLKNLSNLMSRPAALQERVFTRLFEQAEISKFNPQELMQYEDSVNAYRDIVNAINTAKKDSFAEGVAKGIEQRNVEIARKMLGKGMTSEEVADMTGLSIADVDGLE